uniref:BTB domain-containing protein n=1 Tax=Panagrolaimus superbus TaxID=310955 RepID=A0A914YW42_9BILA
MDEEEVDAETSRLPENQLQISRNNEATFNCNIGHSELHYTAQKLAERVAEVEKTGTITSKKSRFSPYFNIPLNREGSPKSSQKLPDFDKLGNLPLGRTLALQQVYTNIAASKDEALQDDSQQWQDRCFTQAEKIQHLFESQDNSDVTFHVGEEKEEITAHRFILILSSPVFEAMFRSNWTEALTQNAIEIPDIEPLAFRRLLRFAYTDSAILDNETVMPILYAARKYQIKVLEFLCIEYLGDNLTPANTFFLLDQAKNFDIPVLIEMCLEQIDHYTTDYFSSDGFLEVSYESLCCIIKRDTLRIRELALFQCVLRWLNAECERRGIDATTSNKREILGHALYSIRFPLISVEEFADVVAASQLLEDKDCVNLFRYFATKKNKLDIPFSFQRRDGEEIVINRFQRIESRWGYNGTPDRVKFQVDAPICLKGFGLFGSMSKTINYSVTMEVSNSNSGAVIAKAKRELQTDGTSEIFRVFFDDPAQIHIMAQKVFEEL